MLRRSDRQGVPVASLFGEEFLDSGEHHAARFHREFGAQVRAARRLGRGLAQKVGAARKGAEELVVEVVAVREHDDGGVFHRRFADDAPGVEGHGQALARSLRVPDDADSLIARLTARLAVRPVTAILPGGLAQLSGAQGLCDRDFDCMELVVARHLLGKRAAALVLEDDEITNQREESLPLADALQHHLQLRHMRIGQRLSRYGAPGLEPFPPGGERADPRFHSVRDHQCRVKGEQRGDFRLVGLELPPGGPYGRVLIGRIFEFEHPERQAVDEQARRPGGVRVCSR